MKWSRSDIQLLSRHSNWSEEGVEQVLIKDVYHNISDWQRFLSRLFLSLGLGFFTIGVVFFIAFNWSSLHKFIKIGLVQGLIVGITLLAVFVPKRDWVKQVLLTSAAVLVGALYAVFGQIYQTGADAYDFFLGWTLFITAWVVVSNFAPLWLIFIALINVTLVTYNYQTSGFGSDINLMLILSVLNSLFFIVAAFVKVKNIPLQIPNWFLYVLSFAILCIATIGMSIGILNDFDHPFLLFLFCTALMYTGCICYGLMQRKAYYLAITALSGISVVSTLLGSRSNDLIMFFLIGFFILASVTIVIQQLIRLQKKWGAHD